MMKLMVLLMGAVMMIALAGCGDADLEEQALQGDQEKAQVEQKA